MEGKKYLYGAAVQGIQSFIFQTNKLREIVGASELVEEICTLEFAKMLTGDNELIYEEADKLLCNDPCAIRHAAGTVNYIFNDEEACRKVVRYFPKRISEFAPGITISQAVVLLDKNKPLRDATEKLAELLLSQRNKHMFSLSHGLIGLQRSRRTNMPVVHKVGEDYLDEATVAKFNYLVERSGRKITYIPRQTTYRLCQKAFGNIPIKKKEVAYNIEKMIDKNKWIAVIHIDGNGMGQVVRKVGTNPEQFKLFSENLNKATVQSAITAFNAVCGQFGDTEAIPIRPVVLGGDDHTLICRGDLAIDYVKNFMQAFEQQTRKYLANILNNKDCKVFTKGNKTDCLTACAGIAFVKSAYPFYYAYDLAEQLCEAAKKDAKNDPQIKAGEKLADSCLMFHKVQDSFNEDYIDVVKRELMPDTHTSFKYGPYYLEEHGNNWTIDNLLKKVGMLNGEEGNRIKSSLRRWMSTLYEDSGKAKQMLSRIINLEKSRSSIIKSMTQGRQLEKDIIAYPTYDMLALHTINSQITRNTDQNEN